MPLVVVGGSATDVTGAGAVVGAAVVVGGTTAVAVDGSR